MRPKINYFGVSFPLWFGTIVHRALEYHYDPTLQRSPLEVFQTEFHTSLQEFVREAPDYVDEYMQEFTEHRDMGVSMMRFYSEYATRHDDFDVVASEQSFEVKVGWRVDDRFVPLVGNEIPETVAQLEVAAWEPVYYCGRMDAVVQDRATGRYGIIDHKTARDFGEGYFDKLDMDEQCTSYMWAAQEYAKANDLPYKQIDFVIYNVLRKCCIRPPTVLQSGKLSIARATESCTYEMFMKEITDRNLAFQLEDPRTQGYIEWLKEEGDGLFVRRAIVRRNQFELTQLASRIQLEIADMFAAAIYPNPTGDWYCIKCPFRSPCLAVNDGSGYQEMLDANYVQNMVSGRYTAY